MDTQKKAAFYLNKIKFWNMVLLIFAGIGTAVGIFELPTTLIKSNQIERYQEQLALTDNPQMIELLEKTMAVAINPLYRVYGVVIFTLGLALLYGFYANNKRLKSGAMLKTWPYYGQIIKIVLAIIVSIVTRSITFAISTSVMTTIFNFLWALPAILVLSHIRHYHSLRHELKLMARETTKK